jgi:hypothetical protein
MSTPVLIEPPYSKSGDFFNNDDKALQHVSQSITKRAIVSAVLSIHSEGLRKVDLLNRVDQRLSALKMAPVPLQLVLTDNPLRFQQIMDPSPVRSRLEQSRSISTQSSTIMRPIG